MSLDDAVRALRIGRMESPDADDLEWIRDKMEEIAGSRDLEEANRRMDVVWEYREEVEDL